jgi:hypothetical protein
MAGRINWIAVAAVVVVALGAVYYFGYMPKWW